MSKPIDLIRLANLAETIFYQAYAAKLVAQYCDVQADLRVRNVAATHAELGKLLASMSADQPQKVAS